MSAKEKKFAKLFRERLVAEHGRCHYCQIRVDPESPEAHPRFPTIDHKTPRSRGGDYSEGNLVLACNLCNHMKGNMTAAEFVVYRRNLRLGMSKAEALRAMNEITGEP